MAKRLHVLFLSSWYPSKVHPLNGNFVQNHAKCVAQLCDVTVLHLITDVNRIKIEVELKEDVIREYIVYMPAQKSLVKFYFFIKMYFAGFKHISEKYGKPDLMHLNITFPVGLIALLFHFVYRIPYIITEHWTKYQDSKKDLTFVFRFISGMTVKNAAAVCPVSEQLSKSMQNLGLLNCNYYTVGNVVDTSVFEIDKLAISPLAVKRIIHISNLDAPEKNALGLMRVFFDLCDKRKDVVIDIVGGGDKQKWIKAASVKGLANRIFFKGPFNQKEVANALKNSDLFVLFSDSENLPCVIIEAFASGLPVASTNVGGIPEMIDQSRGILVNKGDENAMVEAINYMLDNLDNYNSEAIRQYAIDNFSVEAISTKYYNLYGKALNSK